MDEQRKRHTARPEASSAKARPSASVRLRQDGPRTRCLSRCATSDRQGDNSSHFPFHEMRRSKRSRNDSRRQRFKRSGGPRLPFTRARRCLLGLHASTRFPERRNGRAGWHLESWKDSAAQSAATGLAFRPASRRAIRGFAVFLHRILYRVSTPSEDAKFLRNGPCTCVSLLPRNIARSPSGKPP